VTPARLDLVRGALLRLERLEWGQVRELIEEMEAEGQKALVEAGIAPRDVRFTHGADMRYYGQANEVQVELSVDPRTQPEVERLRASFEKAYESLYGIRLTGMDVEVVSWRTSAHGPSANRQHLAALPKAEGRFKGERRVLFETGLAAVAVYDRVSLAAGQVLEGPALIEERDTTIVLRPGWRAEMKSHGGLVATR
jgi:N-methylhydantoinase A